jgi:nickel-dependent lactate racemase
MDIPLLYGRHGLRLTLPPGAVPTLIEKPAMPLIEDPGRAVAAALDRPAGVPPLAELASRCSSACILIRDITRPVPNAAFLRPILERLLAAGIARQRISILVATGLHRPNLGAELAEVVGDPWVLDQVDVANHFARDDAAHVEVGRTSRGTLVRLDVMVSAWAIPGVITLRPPE